MPGKSNLLTSPSDQELHEVYALQEQSERQGLAASASATSITSDNASNSRNTSTETANTETAHKPIAITAYALANRNAKQFGIREMLALNKLPLAISLLSAASYLLADRKYETVPTILKFTALGGIAYAASNSRARVVAAQADEQQEPAASRAINNSNGMLASALGHAMVNFSDVSSAMPWVFAGNAATAMNLFAGAKPVATWTSGDKALVASAGVGAIASLACLVSRSHFGREAKLAASAYTALSFSNFMLAMAQSNNRLPLAVSTLLTLAAEFSACKELDAKAATWVSNRLNAQNSVPFLLQYAAQLSLLVGMTAVAQRPQMQLEQVAEDDHGAQHELEAITGAQMRKN